MAGKKQIAPRLASGERRARLTGGLPGYIKDGLFLRAAKDRKSVSYMLEQHIIEAYGFRAPKYLVAKAKPKLGRG